MRKVNVIKKLVKYGLITLVGLNLFIGCTIYELAPSVTEEYSIDFQIGLPLDLNGHYHLTIDKTKWQTLHRVEGVVTDGYDNLVEELNQTSVPAIGFAMGIERIVEILKHVNQSLSEIYNIIPIINITSENNTYCALQCRELREIMPQKRFFNTDSTSSLSSQLNHAMKMNSHFIILITDENIKDSSFTVKTHANKMNDIIVTKDKLLEMLSKLHDDDCSVQDELDDDFETPGEPDE